MDDKKLVKLFQDKAFLRSNDFVALMDKTFLFLKENKNLVLAFVVVMIAVGLTIPGLKWYQNRKIDAFNLKLYEAQKSLKKESLFKDLISEYKGLTAVQYVRLQLIKQLLDHNQHDEALKIIDEGLDTEDSNIFTTILVLKRLNILKQNKKYPEAALAAQGLENKIIPPFSDKYQMIIAEFYMLAGDKGAARAIYEKLGSFAGVGADVAATLEEFDPVIANRAKDMLLLMDLGVL